VIDLVSRQILFDDIEEVVLVEDRNATISQVKFQLHVDFSFVFLIVLCFSQEDQTRALFSKIAQRATFRTVFVKTKSNI
jgi:hypothetical protein